MRRIKDYMPYISDEDKRRRAVQEEMERAAKEYDRTHWPCGKLR